MACFCINWKHMPFYNNILKREMKIMEKNANKKLVLKIIIIIFGFLYLNNSVLSMKPAKNHGSKQHEHTKTYTSAVGPKLSGKNNKFKKSNRYFEPHGKLSYLNEPTIEETQRNYKKITSPSTTQHQKSKILRFYENEEFKLIEIITESGVIISKKTPKKPKDSNPINKKSKPIYGPYKNDPYDESDEEWDNNSYVDLNPYLIDIDNLSEFFKTMVIENESDPYTPQTHKYYALLLSFDHNFYYNYPSPGYLIRILNTDCLTNYLEELEEKILLKQSYKEDSEKIGLNMFIMDNRIKLSKPLGFSKEIWSKRQKNLNFVIYVKKEFLQNLSPEEWDDIIFYIPLKMLDLTN